MLGLLFVLPIVLDSSDLGSQLGEDGKYVFASVQTLAQTIDDAVIHVLQGVIPAQYSWLLQPLVLSLLSYGLLLVFFLSLLRFALGHLTKVIVVFVALVIAATLLFPVAISQT